MNYKEDRGVLGKRIQMAILEFRVLEEGTVEWHNKREKVFALLLRYLESLYTKKNFRNDIEDGLHGSIEQIDSLVMTKVFNDCIKYYKPDQGFDFINYYMFSYKRGLAVEKGKISYNDMHCGMTSGVTATNRQLLTQLRNELLEGAGIEISSEEKDEMLHDEFLYSDSNNNESANLNNNDHALANELEGDEFDADNETMNKMDRCRKIEMRISNKAVLSDIYNELIKIATEQYSIPKDQVMFYLSSNIGLDMKISREEESDASDYYSITEDKSIPSVEAKEDCLAVFDVAEKVFNNLQERSKRTIAAAFTLSLLESKSEGMYYLDSFIQDFKKRSFWDNELESRIMNEGEPINQEKLANELGILQASLSRSLNNFKKSVREAYYRETCK